LNFCAKHPIAENQITNLMQRHFETLRDERLQYIKSGTVHADIMLFRRIFKTANFKWGYGLPINRVEHLELSGPHQSRKSKLREGEEGRILTAASSQRNIFITSIIDYAIEN